ncbi:MAG: MerR family transcriptional regulator [Bacteroidales bacterium]|nr:MerR family transcriptional regulator [Bacteroidales bacterium]
MAKSEKKEFNPNKLYYTISEIADYFGISVSKIRFWEKEFSTILKPQRTAKGIRQYTKKDIDALKQIKYLVDDCGMTHEGVKKKLSKNRSGVEKTLEVKERLEEIRDMLVGIRDEM